MFKLFDVVIGNNNTKKCFEMGCIPSHFPAPFPNLLRNRFLPAMDFSFNGDGNNAAF